MSVNVFADFSITTLDCDFMQTKQADKSHMFSKKLSVRVNEKRKEMRVNLLPVSQYIKSNSFADYEIGFVFNEHTYIVGLGRATLLLSFDRKLKSDEEFLGAFYRCKII
jgi:hypothetical protein